jgi:hypothetical protein
VRSLERHDVGRLFDHADKARVAPGVAADLAYLFFSEVEAARAEADALLGFLEGAGQRQNVLGGQTKQVKRQPLSRFLADARKPSQLVDQALYGRAVQRASLAVFRREGPGG